MKSAVDKYVFRGAQDPPDYASRDSGPFCQATVKSAGSPLVVAEDGYMKLALDTALESQLACLYQGDELPYDIDHLQQVDFWCKLNTATFPAACSISFGLCTARQNDPDSLAAAAMFRLIGSTAVVCETDDGTNDNDDVATGLTLGTTLKRFTFDFASGVKTVIPPPSVGGKGNVLFQMDNDQSNLRPVGRATRFDMSNYSGGLQLFAQIQKGLASSVIAADVSLQLHIQEIQVRYKSRV